LTLAPWNRDLSLVWCATVADTFVRGHYIASITHAGITATEVEVTKRRKYHHILKIYCF